MEIGCQLPMQGPVATRDALVTFAREAEQHRMASLWVSDHVVFPYFCAHSRGRSSSRAVNLFLKKPRE